MLSEESGHRKGARHTNEIRIDTIDQSMFSMCFSFVCVCVSTFIPNVSLTEQLLTQNANYAERTIKATNIHDQQSNSYQSHTLANFLIFSFSAVSYCVAFRLILSQ